jgi:hypothetical protein
LFGGDNDRGIVTGKDNLGQILALASIVCRAAVDGVRATVEPGSQQIAALASSFAGAVDLVL